VPLTDQARVAVHMARALADAQGTRPNVAHLVAGLAGEPEGIAGGALRLVHGEVAPRIAAHPALDALALPPLETADVALPVMARPCWTLELLQAALRVGGADLAHLLAECGADLGAGDDLLEHRMPGPETLGDVLEAPETYGRLSLLDRGFSHEADLAVARTRARAGDSADLLGWLAADEATVNALSTAPAVPVDRVVARAMLSDLGVGPSDLIVAITHLTLRAALGG
jgi:hypothetical protein